MLTLGPWDESFSAGGMASLFLPSNPFVPPFLLSSFPPHLPLSVSLCLIHLSLSHPLSLPTPLSSHSSFSSFFITSSPVLLSLIPPCLAPCPFPLSFDFSSSSLEAIFNTPLLALIQIGS